MPSDQPPESVEDRVQELLRVVSGLKTEIGSVCTQLKELDKAIKKDRKAAAQATKKSPESKRKPTGFALPGRVSDQLAEFMGLEPGAKVARTAATKAVVEYISEHKLQKPSDRRIIVPDEFLRGLLGSEPDDEVTYFNLQKFLNRHFVSA
jgi:chromatin remodeling complex protein RSC6